MKECGSGSSISPITVDAHSKKLAARILIPEPLAHGTTMLISPEPTFVIVTGTAVNISILHS
jgi:hypothetical protein